MSKPTISPQVDLSRYFEYFPRNTPLIGHFCDVKSVALFFGKTQYVYSTNRAYEGNYEKLHNI